MNILPQKSWNVYGQKNRQRVAEDEAAQAAKDTATAEQQSRALRENVVQRLRSDQVSPAHHDHQHMFVKRLLRCGAHPAFKRHFFEADLSADSKGCSNVTRSSCAATVNQNFGLMMANVLRTFMLCFQGPGSDQAPAHQHINFWADFEDASINPEAEVRVSSISSRSSKRLFILVTSSRCHCHGPRFIGQCWPCAVSAESFTGL